MSDANDHPVEALSSYLDDELAVEDRAPIDRHLAMCPTCREHLEALRRLSRAIASERIPVPPDGLEGKVLRRLDQAAVVPFRRRFLVPASLAATIAAVGLLAVVAWKQGGPRVLTSPETAPDRASGHVESGKQEADKGFSPSERVAIPAAPAPTPEPPAPAATPEPPAPMSKVAESKSERDDAVADEVAVPRVTSSQMDAVGAAVARDRMAPAAAKNTATVTGMTHAPASEAQSRGLANRPVEACAAGAVDSAIEAVWTVADPADAARSLALLAAVHGGRVEPQAAGRVDRFTVVIPAARFASFAGAASSIGVEGFDGGAAPAEGGCVRQHVRLATVARR